MNYMLHFQTKSAEKQVTHQQLKDYFTARGSYTVNDYQALYSNDSTGVYFTFEYGGIKSTGSEQSSRILPVFFNISFGKPHIFVLEAEPELEEFIRNFSLVVSDPSMHGSSYVEFNELDFYRGWNTGNEVFYRKMLLSNPKQKLYSWPVQEMEKIWRWDFHVNDMQSELGQQIFVPKVLFIDYQNRFNTAVVWTDGMPITLPRVEKAILYRRGFTGGVHIGKKEDIAIANIADIEPLLKDYPKTTEHLEYYTIIYKDPPKEIKHFIQAQKTVKNEELVFVPFSDLHDRELIDKIQNGK
jgi:hypothetical protein